jgi:ATP-dependent protease ClpP protease subunit
MAKDAWIMVHEEQDSFKNKPVHDLEVEANHSRAMENQCNSLLEKRTGTSALTWGKMHKATTYLTAKQAKQLGLIDAIF